MPSRAAECELLHTGAEKIESTLPKPLWFISQNSTRGGRNIGAPYHPAPFAATVDHAQRLWDRASAIATCRDAIFGKVKNYSSTAGEPAFLASGRLLRTSANQAPYVAASSSDFPEPHGLDPRQGEAVGGLALDQSADQYCLKVAERRQGIRRQN